MPADITNAFQITIDCADPDRMARFWALALGYRLQEPPAPHGTWREYWVSVGVPEDEAEDGYDSIVDPGGDGPRIWFQQVPEAKVVKNVCTSICSLVVGGECRLRSGSGVCWPRALGWSGSGRLSATR